MGTWINKLERKFGWIAIPHLTFTLMIAQVATLGLSLMGQIRRIDLELNMALVFEGEIWRLVTFLVLPRLSPGQVDPLSIIFVAFALYIFYFLGTTLEAIWKSFKFTLFVAVGWLLTLAVSLLIPGAFFANTYLLTALFIAFARYNGEMQFLIFFVIPVKVKWLAWIAWAFIALSLLLGFPHTKLAAAAGALTLFIFFGRDVFGEVKAHIRSNEFKKQRQREAAEPLHTCTVCGRTDISNPELAFRYDDGYAFCEDHIHLSDQYISIEDTPPVEEGLDENKEAPSDPKQ